MQIFKTIAIVAVTLTCSAIRANGLDRIGRPVRILSLSFHEKPLGAIRDLIDREAAKGVDLVVLPETWRGQNDNTMETLDGETLNALSALARKHHTYIVSPIDRLDGERRVNSAVLLDRNGKVVFIYDKVFPYWSEFDHKKKVEVGGAAPVYQADFGLIGFAICFDVNFPEVWKSLADQGAELVVWPSAYSAGTSLQAHALNNHYYIVSSTGKEDCLVYDITGKELLYQKSKDVNVAHITLDLDRGIYHENFNLAKRDKLLREHANDVEQQEYLEREAWFVLRARRPGVSVRELARQYGLEELRDYIDRSRRDIDAMRGWSFSQKTDQTVDRKVAQKTSGAGSN
jgi:predicted amidohydrolase